MLMDRKTQYCQDINWAPAFYPALFWAQGLQGHKKGDQLRNYCNFLGEREW